MRTKDSSFFKVSLIPKIRFERKKKQLFHFMLFLDQFFKFLIPLDGKVFDPLILPGYSFLAYIVLKGGYPPDAPCIPNIFEIHISESTKNRWSCLPHQKLYIPPSPPGLTMVGSTF